MSEYNSSLQIICISIFPQMFQALDFGITGRARKRGLLHLDIINPRQFSDNKHGHIDDRPYGGGPGMVMMAAPLKRAIDAAKVQLGEDTPVIYLSPQGETIKQATIEKISQSAKMIFLVGRYEGIDQRLIDLYVDEEWSVGDYILSGGELAAMTIIDAATRLLPNALGDSESAVQESFSSGLLDYPHYTRPEVFAGVAVPKVLTSGNHKDIAKWRKQKALQHTKEKRPDLLKS